MEKRRWREEVSVKRLERGKEKMRDGRKMEVSIWVRLKGAECKG